jgi:hypothetical protein
MNIGLNTYPISLWYYRLRIWRGAILISANAIQKRSGEFSSHPLMKCAQLFKWFQEETSTWFFICTSMIYIHDLMIWYKCICDCENARNHEHVLVGLLRPWSWPGVHEIPRVEIWWHPKPWTRSCWPSEAVIKTWRAWDFKGRDMIARDREHPTDGLVKRPVYSRRCSDPIMGRPYGGQNRWYGWRQHIFLSVKLRWWYDNDMMTW